MAPGYPVVLRLAGEPVLVVGGGPVARRKVHGLLAVEASVTVIAPEVHEDLAALAADGRLTWVRRAYGPPDAERLRGGGYRFAVAATDQAEVNEAVVADATAGGTWTNDAGSPDGGPVSLPAVHRAGPVVVAVSTGGRHPGAAAWLRDELAGALDPAAVTALELLDDLQREAGAAGDPPSRVDWREALRSGTLDLIREGRAAEAKERLQACLSSSSD